MTEYILAIMLSFTSGHDHARIVTSRTATFFLETSIETAVPVELLVAVAFAESAFDPSAVSLGGDEGLMQVNPRGMGSVLCRKLMPRIRNLENNIRCGARILAHARARCGGPPLRWLSAFNGRRCGPSVYSRRVLALLTGRRNNRR